MIRGITFDKQLMKSKDNAHEVNFYYSGDLGVTKGCGVSVNASNDIVVAEGYFIIKGRLVSIEGSETIDVPTVPSGTLYSIAVFEIDLTKTNTTTAFNQGSFKILSNASAYPTLTQQDLDNGGTLYQFEFARFENTVGGLVNFSDTRVVLQMSKYAPKNNPTFTGTVSGITKAMVGLGNVDNTSDVNKPISTATQTALDGKLSLTGGTLTGALNGTTITTSGAIKNGSLQMIGGTVEEYNYNGISAVSFNFNGYNNGTTQFRNIDIYDGKQSRYTSFNGETKTLDLIGGRLKFPATQNPSSDANTLDDYEEGTFTMTAFGSVSAGTATYGQNSFSYVKIGKLVSIVGWIAWSNHTGTGSIRLSGLPFNVVGNSSYMNVPIFADSLSLSSGSYFAGAYIDTSTDIIIPKQSNTGTLGLLDIPIDTDTWFMINFTYHTS